jgi:cytoskeletal protein CcmA (bactofilin family)
LTLIEVIRQARQYFVAHMRPRSGVLAGQADRVVLGGNRRTQDRKMADQADDLGIPMNPARPMAGVTVPPRLPDLPRPGAEPAHPPTSSRVPDLSRPGAEPAHAPISPRQQTEPQPGSRDDGVDARTLIVGREISFSGDVTSCDRLIVEGSIEATLKNCQNMIIAETGIFRGNGSTENADVRGRVEGDLVVRKRLLIRASGHVSGTITYGEIEIEAGGKISGTIQAQERSDGLGIKRP